MHLCATNVGNEDMHEGNVFLGYKMKLVELRNYVIWSGRMPDNGGNAHLRGRSTVSWKVWITPESVCLPESYPLRLKATMK